MGGAKGACRHGLDWGEQVVRQQVVREQVVREHMRGGNRGGRVQEGRGVGAEGLDWGEQVGRGRTRRGTGLGGRAWGTHTDWRGGGGGV